MRPRRWVFAALSAIWTRRRTLAFRLLPFVGAAVALAGLVFPWATEAGAEPVVVRGYEYSYTDHVMVVNRAWFVVVAGVAWMLVPHLVPEGNGSRGCRCERRRVGWFDAVGGAALVTAVVVFMSLETRGLIDEVLPGAASVRHQPAGDIRMAAGPWVAVLGMWLGSAPWVARRLGLVGTEPPTRTA